jgi:hypothetical protein
MPWMPCAPCAPVAPTGPTAFHETFDLPKLHECDFVEIELTEPFDALQA